MGGSLNPPEFYKDNSEGGANSIIAYYVTVHGTSPRELQCPMVGSYFLKYSPTAANKFYFYQKFVY